MLTFISFWRAAAIVLNDLGSSAFYAGAIVEQAVGRSAPWFILGIMIFAYAVLGLYIESCSMFVRGGVYRVVKAAMGSTLAKVSVSALMFDFILTGPISGTSAGLYLVGLINELLKLAHSNIVLPTNSTAAAFAILVTIYFWRQNVKGIPESSGKALRIMYVTTTMVVLLLAWCVYTVAVRGAHLPPFPSLENLEYSHEALGWLRGSSLPHTIGAIGIMIGLGHAVLAMSGSETLAQVYREIEHPKLRNLEKAGFTIFVYSLVFTAGVSFFAFMIIPDDVRPQYFGNLISGLAMHFEGPYNLKLVFQAFVVVVGVLMLSGAVNTAIMGSNGVLNRVSEDGILPDWFRQPHPRFGTSYRILNLVVLVQIATIIWSQGDIFLLGEAYAFGVMWSFLFNALAVFVLRYKQPGPRGFKVPINFKIGGREIPIGLTLIATVLLAICVINFFTKEIATISGVAFTAFLFSVFTITERVTKKHATAEASLDKFNLQYAGEITAETVGCKPRNILVPISNYHAMYHLDEVLERAERDKRDVVVLHVRLLQRVGSGESELERDQLFSNIEQHLFTKVLALSEKHGESVHLAVVTANDLWEGILRAALNLQSSRIVLGRSSKFTGAELARQIGLAWERLPEPRPQFDLELLAPAGGREYYILGPHAPHLTANEVKLIHEIWLRFSDRLAPEEIHHHDIVHFALNEVMQEIAQGKEQEVVQRLREHVVRNHKQQNQQPTLSK
ncbi:MAG: amino acid permease [Acidobacteria bacterium]|nr:amino acid permease [Acidobacteriota bacterium]